MKRAFVDIETYSSRNMNKDRNIDYQYWLDKSIKQKVDRNILSSYKRPS